MIPNTSLKTSDLNLTTDSAIVADQLVFHVTVFTSVVLGILCFCGCMANIGNMVVFARIGFKESVNVSLFGLAVSDFGSCLTSAFYALTINPLIVVQFDFPVDISGVSLLTIIYPHITCVKITIMITAFVVFERCLCVALPMKVKLLITPKRSRIIVIFIFAFIILSHIPVYYAYRLKWVFDPATNRSIYSLTSVQHGIQIDSIFLYIQMFFNLTGPYIFIAVCTVILLINLMAKAKWRSAATKSGTDEQTTKFSTKDKKVANLVLFVSALFIICSFPSLPISFALVYIPEISPTGSLYRLYIIFHMFNFITEAINATFNIVIYYNTSSKYKSNFDQIFINNDKTNSQVERIRSLN